MKKIYKLTHVVTNDIRFEIAESKRAVKKGADFQEKITLITNSKSFLNLYT